MERTFPEQSLDHQHDQPTAKLLHTTPTFSIFHKPAGMPITGNKPHTLLNTLPQTPPPVPIAVVPRQMSGPAIISRTTPPTITPEQLHYTFSAIVQTPHNRLPNLLNMSVKHIFTVPSTSGPLSLLLIHANAPGYGLRKQLLRCGAPAVGTTGGTYRTRCAKRALYIACTNLEIPHLGITIDIPLPKNFETLLKREQHFAQTRISRAENRLKVVDGRTCVRFLGHYFLTDGVMNPRESSEILATTAAGYLRRAERSGYLARLLDLGTGSGALLITTLQESGINAIGIGVDNCETAVTVARRNVEEAHLANVTILHADFGELRDVGVFDVVVSNPPYLTPSEVRRDACFFGEEPESALVAGEDGMDGYRAIASVVGGLLVAGGVLVLEIGARRDPKVVGELFRGAGLVFVELLKDFRGFDRCLVLRKPG